ncbi:MAG: peptide-methionine (R)-S-oxide reductase MsrB [Flavobacteriales bacterium]
MKEKLHKSEAEWREQLSEEEYRILREKGTERAFTGEYDIHFEDGAYHCAGCKTKLFDSGSKYDSGCGWPAFYKTAEGGAVVEKLDKSFGMIRTEVLCGTCGGHLGHVFPDGPSDKGGMRYCINSVSIKFDSEEEK